MQHALLWSFNRVSHLKTLCKYINSTTHAMVFNLRPCKPCMQAWLPIKFLHPDWGIYCKTNLLGNCSKAHRTVRVCVICALVQSDNVDQWSSEKGCRLLIPSQTAILSTVPLNFSLTLMVKFPGWSNSMKVCFSYIQTIFQECFAPYLCFNIPIWFQKKVLLTVCWLSSPLWEVFPRYSSFLLSTKTCIWFSLICINFNLQCPQLVYLNTK